MISGCESTSVSQASQKAGKSFNSSQNKESQTVQVNTKTNSQTAQSNPLFQTTLTLPNGVIISTDKVVKWKDLSIQLLVTNLPAPSNTTDGYKEIIGNHSTIISHEVVKTSAGNAVLVLNERTPPAATKSIVPTFEYWVIVYGRQYTYAINATIIGNREKAKSEIFSLLNRWKAPKNTT